MNLLAKKLLAKLKSRRLDLVTVESCTGGALADAITSVPGSSASYRGGFITYSDQSKIKLGVRKSVIKEFSPYSEAVAEAMAVSGRRRLGFGKAVSISITGVLSRPDPKYSKEPVGLVWIGVIGPKGLATTVQLNVGKLPRERAKAKIVAAALKLVVDEL